MHALHLLPLSHVSQIVSCIGNTLAVWDMKGKALRNVLRLHTPAPQPTLTTQCAKSRVSPPRTAQEFHAEGIRKQLHKVCTVYI